VYQTPFIYSCTCKCFASSSFNSTTCNCKSLVLHCSSSSWSSYSYLISFWALVSISIYWRRFWLKSSSLSTSCCWNSSFCLCVSDNYWRRSCTRWASLSALYLWPSIIFVFYSYKLWWLSHFVLRSWISDCIKCCCLVELSWIALVVLWMFCSASNYTWSILP